MSKLDWLTQEIDSLKEQGLYNRIRTIGSGFIELHFVNGEVLAQQGKL